MEPSKRSYEAWWTSLNNNGGGKPPPCPKKLKKFNKPLPESLTRLLDPNTPWLEGMNPNEP